MLVLHRAVAGATIHNHWLPCYCPNASCSCYISFPITYKEHNFHSHCSLCPHQSLASHLNLPIPLQWTHVSRWWSTTDGPRTWTWWVYATARPAVHGRSSPGPSWAQGATPGQAPSWWPTRHAPHGPTPSAWPQAPPDARPTAAPAPHAPPSPGATTSARATTWPTRDGPAPTCHTATTAASAASTTSAWRWWWW
jgi:hypothetical protein